MKPAQKTVWKLVSRAFLLLVAFQVLDWAVFSRVPTADRNQGIFMQVLVGLVATAVFLGPLVRDLFLGEVPGERAQLPIPTTESGPNSRAPNAMNNRRLLGMFVAEILLLGLMWAAIAGVLPIVRLNNGSYVTLMRHAVLFSALVAAAVLVAVPLDWESDRKPSRIGLTGPVFVNLIIAAASWWLAPAIVLLVCTPTFQSSEYLRVVFPAWYVLLPFAALALRQYRGA